ncbi:MAG TPA: hypothetical protein VEJ41_03875 [Candidatus Acidoferrales bacterium]|nr:hypothetical protein [Candidatus Acidoferrales bacterium]
MDTSTETLTIVTATGFEAAAIGRAVPGVRVVRGGVGLVQARAERYDVVVSCGLAGGLRADLPTGTIVIPHEVETDNGERISCDPHLNAALVAAATQLGHGLSQEKLLTSAALVIGTSRSLWAQRGFVAADMETGFVSARRIAALRIILDTPRYELSPLWLKPASVVIRPWLWSQGLWLSREGARCMRIVSDVLKLALPQLIAQ